jgi:hypothetical protein
MKRNSTYLVEIDHGLPELLVGLVEVPHTNLTEVTGMVLVEVGTVVVLTTGHTTTTGVLTVLADTTVTGGHMTAARRRERWKSVLSGLKGFSWCLIDRDRTRHQLVEFHDNKRKCSTTRSDKEKAFRLTLSLSSRNG